MKWTYFEKWLSFVDDLVSKFGASFAAWLSILLGNIYFHKLSHLKLFGFFMFDKITYLFKVVYRFVWAMLDHMTHDFANMCV